MAKLTPLGVLEVKDKLAELGPHKLTKYISSMDQKVDGSYKWLRLTPEFLRGYDFRSKS